MLVFAFADNLREFIILSFRLRLNNEVIMKLVRSFGSTYYEDFSLRWNKWLNQRNKILAYQSLLIYVCQDFIMDDIFLQRLFRWCNRDGHIMLYLTLYCMHLLDHVLHLHQTCREAVIVCAQSLANPWAPTVLSYISQPVLISKSAPKVFQICKS